jgi:hypothetical protein
MMGNDDPERQHVEQNGDEQKDEGGARRRRGRFGFGHAATGLSVRRARASVAVQKSASFSRRVRNADFRTKATLDQ